MDSELISYVCDGDMGNETPVLRKCFTIADMIIHFANQEIKKCLLQD